MWAVAMNRLLAAANHFVPTELALLSKGSELRIYFFAGRRSEPIISGYPEAGPKHPCVFAAVFLRDHWRNFCGETGPA